MVGLIQSRFVKHEMQETRTIKPWNGLQSTPLHYEAVEVKRDDPHFDGKAFRVVGVWMLMDALTKKVWEERSTGYIV